MLGIALLIFRYLFLALLYIFIFRLVWLMLRDLGSLPAPVQQNFREAQDNTRQAQVYLRLEDISRPPGARAGLVLLTGGEKGAAPGKVFSLGEHFSLGRSSENNFVLSDPFASQEHAVINIKNGQYWLEDLGSKNGTYLNDVLIKGPTVLTNNDRVRIGSVTCQFMRWAYEMESDN